MYANATTLYFTMGDFECVDATMLSWWRDITTAQTINIFLYLRFRWFSINGTVSNVSFWIFMGSLWEKKTNLVLLFVLSLRKSSSIHSLTGRRCIVDVEFQDLHYDVKYKWVKTVTNDDGKMEKVKMKTKTILSSVSGHFQHGKINVIMGPSGAGKTSLLNSLAGFNTIVEGSIIINGVSYPAKKALPIISKISSYIMQDDHLLLELTVRETVYYSIIFKQWKKMSEAEIRKMIRKVLKCVGLFEFRKQLVGTLSGGQKKRLAVAVELVNYKPILFLDECTTGLDSTSCYKLIKLLKTMAKGGCNVIATVHQPNSLVYRMFDHLMVMAPGGICAYQGHPIALASAFEFCSPPVLCPVSANIADVLFEQRYNGLNESVIELLHAYWETLDAREQREYLFNGVSEKHKSSPPKSAILSGEELISVCDNQQINSLISFWILFRRKVRQASRDKIFFYGRYITFVLVAILLGLLFQGIGSDAAKVSQNVIVLYFVCNAILAAPAIFVCMQAEGAFKSFMRETVNSWFGIGPYFWAHAIFDIIATTVLACFFTLLVWWMTDQMNMALTLPMEMFILQLEAVSCHFYMYSVSIWGDDKTNFQLPFVNCMIFTLIGGYLKPVLYLPPWIQWLAYIFFPIHAYSATLHNLYSPADGSVPQIPCKSMEFLCLPFPNGTAVLNYHSIPVFSPFEDIWRLILFATGFCLLAWLALYKRTGLAKRQIARI